MARDGMLERALAVLGCFSEQEPALTTAQISERTGIALSSAHRLLASMLDKGLLMPVPGRRYSIGVRLWELGELSPVSVRLRECANPHLMRLYEATGENVHLAVLDGATPQTSAALFIGRITGRQSIPTLSRAGGRDPLHATGVGKALLATRDAAWLARYFTGTRERETQHTICDESALRAEIDMARARGYATTREEMTLGNISVAVWMPSVDGLPPAALGVVVHLDRADERRLAALVTQTARELHADLRDGD
ncbi:IclR family transcriptional regulator [Paramicrobacterium fandaimingii]|uniref:IclR family transcriptional regulator n=1 Tax=Paramicrobacterium fandaimingii TaxID=2708079 RepID=UPI0014245BEF|nr:IclR family transcriptional regulator [Microbacterium fandaimingii]